MIRRTYGMGLLLLFTGAAAVAQSDYDYRHPAIAAQQQGPPVKEFFNQGLQEQQRWYKYQPMAPLKISPQQGRWWSNPQTAEALGVTGDQVKKMDDIFQQHRLKLIDLNASLAKEEAILDPLVGTDQPDDAKVLPQIDRVAQARAELEKANARMLWAIRRVLTPEQWKKLQSGVLRPRIGKQ